MSFSEFDIECMHAALEQARIAAKQQEVPVGAVIAYENKIIAATYNQPITDNDPTAHAEIMALRAAGKVLNNYRLLDTTMYVTLEPCAMCASAMLHARIKRLVYATPDPKTGAIGSAIDLYNAHTWNHKIECQHGLLASEAAKILRDFFAARRL